MKTHRTTGFTIVELLIVIVVIAILASITIVSYSGIQNRAKTVKNLTTAKGVAEKAEIWNSLTGTYPSYTQLVTNTLNPGGTASSPTPGSQAGPEEARLGNGVSVALNDYPRSEGQVTYIQCATPGGFYIVYMTPSAGSFATGEIPVGKPTPIIYGSTPYCL